MIVHIGGGARNIGEDLPYLRRIIGIIREHGGHVARNWIEVTAHNVQIKAIKDSDVNWQEIARQNREALEISDLYIAEVTSYRLSAGYEMSQAMQLGIPVLLLSRKPFRERAICGIQHDLFVMKDYSSLDDLERHVSEFIKTNIAPASELNRMIALTPRLYAYVKEQMQKTDETEDDVLLRLIQEGTKKTA